MLIVLFVIGIFFNALVFGPWFIPDDAPTLKVIWFVVMAGPLDALIFWSVKRMIQDLRRLSRGEPLQEISQKEREYAEAVTRAAYARRGGNTLLPPPPLAHAQPVEEQPRVSDPPALPIASPRSVSGIFFQKLEKVDRLLANSRHWIVVLIGGGIVLLMLTLPVSFPSAGSDAIAFVGVSFFVLGIALSVGAIMLMLVLGATGAVLSIAKTIRSAPRDEEPTERPASLRSNTTPTTEPGPDVGGRPLLVVEFVCLAVLAIGVTLMALSHVIHALHVIVGSR
jgi:hypothetical protein